MKKQSEKEMQARLYQENLDFIARKAALKAADFDEDRRINAEAERKFRNEDESKKREIAKRMNRSVSGKAHEVVDVSLFSYGSHCLLVLLILSMLSPCYCSKSSRINE